MIAWLIWLGRSTLNSIQALGQAGIFLVQSGTLR